jgi:hypothetical protein
VGRQIDEDKISSGALLDLLAGKVGQQEFFEE